MGKCRGLWGIRVAGVEGGLQPAAETVVIIPSWQAEKCEGLCAEEASHHCEVLCVLSARSRLIRVKGINFTLCPSRTIWGGIRSILLFLIIIELVTFWLSQECLIAEVPKKKMCESSCLIF